MSNDTRQTLRQLTPGEIERIARIKAAGQDLADLIKSAGPGRETSLALTKVEEAVMWAVKGVTG